MKSLLLFFVFLSATAFGQKFITEKSKVTFFSEATLENITATNTKTSGILNFATDEFAFSTPIKDFEFAKSLMKEHFNEKYMETEKFPKATFAGKIDGFDKNSSELQKVIAKGKFTIHGVTRELEIPGTIQKSKTGYNIVAKFPIKLEDYQIKIPELMWQKIAEQVDVTTEFSLKQQ